MSTPTGSFHDAATGETIERELTAEEIAELNVSAEPSRPPAPE